METIKATPNYSKKTFTIRKFEGKKLVSKFKTFALDSENFSTGLYMTTNDWKFFLRNNQNYKLIK